MSAWEMLAAVAIVVVFVWGLIVLWRGDGLSVALKAFGISMRFETKQKKP